MNFSSYLAIQLIELEKHCANLQERDRQEYEEELISSRNRSRIFKFLKSFQKEKFPPKIVHLDWNSVAENSKEKAELFNTYFSSVVTDESYDQIDAPPLLEAGGQRINFTEKEITKELEMLFVTESRGADGIPPILLKKTAKTVSKSIKSLFNYIGRLHSVPGSWKHGLVSTIFKDGNKSEVKNYRPVTLLNIISKVFEKFVLKFFSEDLLNSITSCQFGFVTRRSVILQLILSLSNIFENLSSSEEFCFLLLFDFSKAFDKIKHSVLIKKLARMNIPRSLFLLIKQSVTQSVNVDGYQSEKRLVSCGVPQGSVRGPILFLIYINDLPNVVFPSLPLLFADDLKLIHCSKNDSLDKLQVDLNNLHKWSVLSCLLFNYKKCSFTQFAFGSRVEDVVLSLEKKLIEEKMVVKDLGLTIVDTLNWIENVRNRIAKAMKAFYLFRRNTSCAISMKTNVHLYRAIISPTLMFASECWELKRNEYQILEWFNKKVMKWMTNRNCYKEAIVQSNILPPLYFKVLKDLLFSSIVSGKYDFDLRNYYVIQWAGRRSKVILPEIRFEAQRLNFWYRIEFRVNILQRKIKFFDNIKLKGRLLELMWKFFNENWAENNFCSWFFLCLCQNCCANSML